MCDYCAPRTRPDYTTPTLEAAAAYARDYAMPSLRDDDERPTRSDAEGMS